MSSIKQPQLLRELQHAFKQQVGVDQEGNILLGYSGELNSSVTDSLLLLTENAVIGAGATRKQMRRIGSVLIECLQNVSRHGWINDEGKLDLYLTVELTPLGYQIQCGNLVDIEMAADLRSRLSEVNGLTHEELRVRYVDVMCQNELSTKGGAGLGLLSMAKRSNGPLDYHFNEIQQEMYLFTLAVMVKN